MAEIADYIIDRMIFGNFDNPIRRTKRKMAFRFEKKTYNTKLYSFRGRASYAKVYEPDEYKGQEFWKINLHPDKEVVKEIKDSGTQVRPKLDNEESSGVSGPYFTFRRPLSAKIKDQVVQFNPPEIFDKDGKAIMVYVDDKAVGEKVYIGNGSEVEVTVEIYDTQMGKGTRLRSVKIIDLIKYDPNSKEEVQKDEPEVREQKGSTTEKSRKTLDDDIPF